MKEKGCLRNKHLVNYIIAVILMVLCLFAPEFRGLPKYTWVLAGIGLFVFVRELFERRAIDLQSLRMYGIWLFCAILAFLVVFINGSQDYSYIVFLVGTLLSIFRNYLVIYFINRCCEKKDNKVHKYMEIYIIACVVCVFFTLTFIVLPEFKDFWLDKVIYTEVNDYYAYVYRYSIGGFAAFSYSSTVSIALLFNAYLLGENVENANCYKYLSTFILLIVGALFYGRITIVAIALSAILGVVITKLSKPALKRVILPLAVIFGVLLLGVSILAQFSVSMKNWMDWAFALVTQLFSKEGITDWSFTHMFDDMYFLPDLKTLFVGDGMYTMPTGGYYMSTDVGFLRAILFYGIFGCLANYAIPISFAISTKKIYKKNRNLDFFLGLLLVLFFVLELKGEAFHRIFLAIMPIYYFMALEEEKIWLSFQSLYLYTMLKRMLKSVCKALSIRR